MIAQRAVRRTHVTRASAVHRATGPNQVWSWDITWLPTVVRGKYLYLYLVMDVWSRRIVGWTVYERESPDLAAALIQRVCSRLASIRRASSCTPTTASRCAAHDARDAPATRRRAVLQPAARLRRQPVLGGALPDAEAHAGLSEAALRQRRAGSRVGRSLRRLVQQRCTATAGSAYVTPDERHFGREHAILARRHALYEKARRTQPERWTRDTRNWEPVGTVILNPEPQLAATA